VRAEIADADGEIESQQSRYGDAGIVGLAEEMEGPVTKLNECIQMVSFCCASTSSQIEQSFCLSYA
jgi:hypothetical protein